MRFFVPQNIFLLYLSLCLVHLSPFSEYFFNYLLNLFLIVLGLPSCTQSFLSLWAVGATLQLQCMGFLLRWLLFFWSTGSRAGKFSSCISWSLEGRLRSCGARTQLPFCMRNFPGLGIKLVSPSLADSFQTTRQVLKINFLNTQNKMHRITKEIITEIVIQLPFIDVLNKT